MSLGSKLIHNLILDWKKHSLSKFEKAELIREYLDAKNISIREMGRDLDIPKSTLEDWLLWNKISEQDYDQLIEEGKSHSDIYRGLRSGVTKIKQTTTLELQIDKILITLNKPLRLDLSTVNKIKELQKLLRKITNDE